MDVENTIFTKIGYPLRHEREMINNRAMREAVVNAIVRNDYSNGAVPKFEFFSDRLEITSAGGLPFGVTEDEFFSGYSTPRNKELMRVFRDLEIVEQLGSGVPRIVEKYGRKAFEIRANFIRVVFPYAVQATELPADSGKTVEETVEKTVEETVEKIIQAMKGDPGITIDKLSQITGLSTRGVEWNLKKLKKTGRITRVGPRKGGQWKVLEPENES